MDPIKIPNVHYMTPFNEFDSFGFYIIGPEENRKDSYVAIENKELFRGDTPLEGGIYDSRMGTTDMAWNCGTCENPKALCSGHPGSIELKYPVKSPLFRDQLLKWLKVICHKCGNPVIKRKFRVPKDKLLSHYVKQSRQIKRCEYCGEDHPLVVKTKNEPLAFYREFYTDKVRTRKEQIYNHEIKKILEKISDDTIQELGKQLRSHPKKFILDVIRVPPNTIRPDIRKIGGNRSNNNDITALVKSIVMINEKLPDQIPSKEVIEKEWKGPYYDLDAAYYEMVKGSSMTYSGVRVTSGTGRPLASLASRIPKKRGRIRGNLMGRRTHNMYRSVITGDNYIKINEVGVPLAVAKSIQIPEVVQPYNRDRLETYFMNKDKYPGCKRIIKKSNGKSYRRINLPDNYILQDGDIVERDIVDGDKVNINRQPTLLYSSIGCHTVKVINAKTMGLNVSACVGYNADSKPSGSE